MWAPEPRNESSLGQGYLEIGERDGKRTLRFEGQALIQAP
jgi:hypothetical protein